MIVFPAIDLKSGQVVRLAEGDMDRATVYGDDPAAQALLFAEAGARHLHVVDLDGSFAGSAQNREAVEAILKAFPGHVQLGGGIRSLGNIETWLGAGVARVILGTIAVRDPALVKEAARKYPGRVAVGIDARNGLVATEGWVETSTLKVADLAKRFEDAGVAAIIFTDIGRDGALTGVNVEATARLADAVSIPIIASGGVASVKDITDLKAHAGTPIAGAILGRSLYAGTITPAEALEAARA